MFDQNITPPGFNQIYTVRKMIGRGGFGTVYAGYRNCDHMNIAVKMVGKKRARMVQIYHQDKNMSNSKEEGSYTKIPVEVYLMQKAKHISGVTELIDYYELSDCYLLIMERFGTPTSGCKDLFDFISRNGPLEEHVAQKVFQQIVEIIVSCHKAGIFHGDIKDENILIDERNNQVKLIDFGSGRMYHKKIYTDFDGKTILY